MSSYCPQMFYFYKNGAYYYYCQDCDSCSYVVIALGQMVDCGDCCQNCCPEPCNELVSNADPEIVALLKKEPNAVIPVGGVKIDDYVTAHTRIRRPGPGISIETDELVTMVDENDQNTEICRLRLVTVRVALAGGHSRVLYVGQQLDPHIPAAGKKVVKASPSTGTYHRVRFVDAGDNRKFDVITKDRIG